MTRLERFIKGLQLIQQIDPDADTSADHDEILVYSLKEELATLECWGEEFEDQMDELGFNWDDGWRYFT